MTITVGIGALTITDVVNVARHDTPIVLDPAALAEVAKTRQHIEELATEPTPVYGVSTGFGALARRHIPQELRTQLQRSLVRSHAAGSGPEVERDVIRALMLLRLSTLMTGRTGVRPVVVETYAALLNAGITPIVYEYGSLGCSGDLAPLAHCALALMGEGDVRLADGTKTPAADALAAAGITPLILAEKEGLALINGTDGMLGMLCLTLADLANLITTADIATAMTLEGLRGTPTVFADDLQQLRPHPGQARCAANIRTLVADSGILAAAHAEFQRNHVQDAYSIRCSPQVTGAVRDTADYATTVANRELAAAIDNPVVTLDGRVVSNGNFHGAPIAYVLDFLAIAVADLASISERRTDRFLDVARNRGLNAFLADDPGVDSGHMIAQYTQAGIVSELKRNATPASVDSIPSSAMQEEPRLHGMVRGPETPPQHRRARPRSRHRNPHRRPCHRPPHHRRHEHPRAGHRGSRGVPAGNRGRPWHGPLPGPRNRRSRSARHGRQPGRRSRTRGGGAALTSPSCIRRAELRQ